MTKLPYDPEEARAAVDNHRKLEGLHAELASYYRAGSTDKRTINRMWELLEELEALL